MSKETNIKANVTTEEETKKLTKRDKLMIGVTVASTCVAGYFGVKHFKDAKIQGALIKSNKDLKDSVDTLMAAASEGVFEEAIGTVNNKITYRVDKEKYLLEWLKSNPNDAETTKALSKVRSELMNLYKRRDKIEAAQNLYEIKNEI